MIRVVHPGFFTHPGCRIQGSKRHLIPDSDPQQWFFTLRHRKQFPVRMYSNSEVNVWYKIFVHLGVPWHLCWLDPHQRHGCGQDQGEHRGGNSRQVHQVSNRSVVISLEVVDPLILLRKMFQLWVGPIRSGPYFKFPLVRIITANWSAKWTNWCSRRRRFCHKSMSWWNWWILVYFLPFSLMCGPLTNPLSWSEAASEPDLKKLFLVLHLQSLSLKRRWQHGEFLIFFIEENFFCLSRCPAHWP